MTEEHSNSSFEPKMQWLYCNIVNCKKGTLFICLVSYTSYYFIDILTLLIEISVIIDDHNVDCVQEVHCSPVLVQLTCPNIHYVRDFLSFTLSNKKLADSLCRDGPNAPLVCVHTKSQLPYASLSRHLTILFSFSFTQLYLTKSRSLITYFQKMAKQWNCSSLVPFCSQPLTYYKGCTKSWISHMTNMHDMTYLSHF